MFALGSCSTCQGLHPGHFFERRLAKLSTIFVGVNTSGPFLKAQRIVDQDSKQRPQRCSSGRIHLELKWHGTDTLGFEDGRNSKVTDSEHPKSQIEAKL